MANSPFGVGVLGSPIATGQAPSRCSPRTRVICRLLRSSTMRDSRADCRTASSAGSAARPGRTDPANRPANITGANDRDMRHARLAGLNVFIAARKNCNSVSKPAFFRISLVSRARPTAQICLVSALLPPERSPCRSKNVRGCWSEADHEKGGGHPPPDQQPITDVFSRPTWGRSQPCSEPRSS